LFVVTPFFGEKKTSLVGKKDGGKREEKKIAPRRSGPIFSAVGVVVVVLVVHGRQIAGDAIALILPPNPFSGCVFMSHPATCRGKNMTSPENN
jgi:hypothetical protein